MYIKPLSVCTKHQIIYYLIWDTLLMNVNCLCREWFSCNKTHATTCLLFLSLLSMFCSYCLLDSVALHLGCISSRFITFSKYKHKPLKKQITLIKGMAFIQTTQQRNQTGSGRLFQVIQAAGCKQATNCTYALVLTYGQLKNYWHLW